MIKLKDYYSQRFLNPNGRSLALFQYKFENESIFSGNLEYKISARFIGNGYIFVHMRAENNHFVNDFFNEDESVELVHKKLLNRIVA